MAKGKTNGNRNRSAGHNLEKLVARLLREAGFPHVVTCRSENQRRDGQGIDLMNTDEITNGRLPYNIQCKNATERPKYDQLLKEMPQLKDIMNVIIHKYTAKSEQGIFMPRGYFAILNMNDFIKLISELQKAEARIRELQELTSFAAKNLMEHDSAN